MNEMKLASWMFPIERLPSAIGAAAMSDIDMSSHPDMVEHLADWTPVSHTISGGGDGAVLLTILLTRKVEAPDDAAAI